ncbi:MAG: hypothetical protein K6L74_16835 [Neptuniibacter sp.]
MINLNFDGLFVPLIERGLKPHTLRKRDKDISRGDVLRLTEEVDGERRAFLITSCSRVQPVMITPFGEFYIDGISIDPEDTSQISRAEGFKNYDALLLYIKDKYGLPFNGQLIHWPRPTYHNRRS